MLYAFSYVNYVLHLFIQHLYFYETINTENKLVYLGLILNFIFTYLVPFLLPCVDQFLQVSAKSTKQAYLKFQKHKKIDSDIILKQQTLKNKCGFFLKRFPVCYNLFVLLFLIPISS